MKLKEGRVVPDFNYPDPYGEGEKNFYDFAGDGKTFLVFLRYYGCTVCRLDLHVYGQRYREFLDKGAKIAVVLQSDPDLVAREAPRGTFPFEIICNPGQELYRQFEVEPAKNKLSLVGSNPFKALEKMRAAKKFGFEHGEYEGNEQQLPALFLLNGDKKVLYGHYAAGIADMPSVDEMLAKL